jgi:arylsulfatase A-like enzyme
MSKRPNILFIFSDQHRAQAMSCAGDQNVFTPNIDRLASEGVRFTNAYSSSPMCAPARACLYTGQYITTHGVNCLFKPLLPRQPVLAEVLREAGYHTSHMGKWHLSGGDCPSHFVSPYFRPGWDDWMGWENSNRFFATEYGVGPMPMPIVTMDGYQTDVITDMTIDWIRNREAESPWFHVMSFEPPHPPYQAPDRYMEMMEEREIVFRPNVPHDRRGVDLKRSLRGYYAQIRNMDDNIGRILDMLDETGRRDDTIVVYFSDHGSMLGSHGRMHKEVPEEESSNIPLIFRCPGTVASDRVSDALIGIVDIMPSLLGLVSVPVPETVEGSDLSALIAGDTDEGPESLLIQFDRAFFDYNENHDLTTRTIRTGPWKYTLHYEAERSRMFDLESDPYELTNLIASPEHASVRADLHARLARELESIGDPFLKNLPAGHTTR